MSGHYINVIVAVMVITTMLVTIVVSFNVAVGIIMRRRCARSLWGHGVGKALGFDTFEAYFATIPEIPWRLLLWGWRKFPFLVLVETRLALTCICKLLDIKFDGGDGLFVAYDERSVVVQQPYWIQAQDGRKYRGLTVCECRERFGKREMGLIAIEGVCFVSQYPSVLGDLTGENCHVMDLPGSVVHNDRDEAAYLYLKDGRMRLDFGSDCSPYEESGSASRRKCA